MKLSHGPGGGSGVVFLADLLDSDEYADADHADGTFAAYLRYGSVSFDQTRVVLPEEVPRYGALRMGVLEPKEE